MALCSMFVNYMSWHRLSQLTAFATSITTDLMLARPTPIVTFAQSFHGAMYVRTGINRNRSLHWMHVLILTVVCGNGGSIITPTAMGQSMTILSDDFAILCCIISFILVHKVPLVLRIGQWTPIRCILTITSQLYRTAHTIKYTTIAFRTLTKEQSFLAISNPKIYPIPIFGPLVYGTFFGCMGGCLQRAFHSRLEREGLPRTIRNGFLSAAFYHFMVHDQTGPIGSMMRRLLLVPCDDHDSNESTAIAHCAIIIINSFMIIDGICQLIQAPQSLTKVTETSTLRCSPSIAKRSIQRDDDGYDYIQKNTTTATATAIKTTCQHGVCVILPSNTRVEATASVVSVSHLGDCQLLQQNGICIKKHQAGASFHHDYNGTNFGFKKSKRSRRHRQIMIKEE